MTPNIRMRYEVPEMSRDEKVSALLDQYVEIANRLEEIIAGLEKLGARRP